MLFDQYDNPGQINSYADECKGNDTNTDIGTTGFILKYSIIKNREPQSNTQLLLYIIFRNQK